MLEAKIKSVLLKDDLRYTIRYNRDKDLWNVFIPSGDASFCIIEKDEKFAYRAYCQNSICGEGEDSNLEKLVKSAILSIKLALMKINKYTDPYDEEEFPEYYEDEY